MSLNIPSIIMSILRFSLFALCIIGIAFQQAKAETLVGSFHNEQDLLFQNLSLLEDPSGKLTEDNVNQIDPAQWQAAPDFSQNQGYSTSTFWLKFTLHNSESELLERMLVFKSSQLEHVDLYIMQKDGTWEVRRSGVLVALRKRDFPHRTAVFQLHLPANSDTNFLIKIRSSTTIKLAFGLEKVPAFVTQRNWENVMFGIFYGTLFGIAVYNFFIFLIVRSRSYLFYSIYQLCLILFSFGLDSTLVYFFPDSVINTGIFRNTVIAFGFISGLQFVRLFLTVPSHFPKIDKFINLLMLLVIPILSLPFVPHGWISWLFRYSVVLSGTLTIFAIIIGVLTFRKGVIEARYFLYGWLMLMFGVTIFDLAIFGVIPSNFFTEHGFQFGAMCEAILLSLALADRINQIRKEKDAAQLETLVAQQQSLDNLERADELKDLILANTTHELRTPLHGIIGLVEAILAESGQRLSKFSKENLKLILNSGKRLNHLINDLLDMSALGKGQIQLQQESVSLRSTVESVLHLSEPLIAEKQLELHNNIERGLAPIQADPGRLQQILLNLVNNAIKYTESGNIAVSANLDHEKMEICVSDEGPGISAELHETIFGAFEQGVPAYGKLHEGVGLGLNICKQLVEAHGGRIWIEPTDKGTSICFTMTPIQKPKDEIEPPEESHLTNVELADLPLTEFPPAVSADSPVNSSLGHILVVDDDAVNLHVLLAHLSSGNYTITACSNGQEALEVLDKDPGIDLVLLDVMMPEIDGFEITEIMRESYSKKELPILLLTALNSREDIVHGFESGANDYLCKPLLRHEMLARISAHLQLSQRWIQRQSASRAANRKSIVELHQTSLRFWENNTEKTMLDLAQESGWGTHIEKESGTWRSRGFEKYLALESLPTNPRWRKVSQTAQYVSKQLPADSDNYRILKKLLDQLTQNWQRNSLAEKY